MLVLLVGFDKDESNHFKPVALKLGSAARLTNHDWSLGFNHGSGQRPEVRLMGK